MARNEFFRIKTHFLIPSSTFLFLPVQKWKCARNFRIGKKVEEWREWDEFTKIEGRPMSKRVGAKKWDEKGVRI